MRAIDADAFRKVLVDRQITIQFFHPAERNELGYIIDLLDYIPPIDPESLRPQGAWIYHIDDLFPAEGTQECSNCHQEEKISLCNENYCPNCGARMGKDGDSE